jgi:polysaccharide pyruvyl transferase CsaB
MLGYFGADNFGDDALLVDWLNRHGEWLADQGLGIDVLTNGGDPLQGFVEAETLGRLPIRLLPKQRALSVDPRQYRAVIAPGGSLLQDATSLRSLLFYLWLIRRFALARVPVYLLNQGVGPLQGVFARWLTPRVLRLCRMVSLRDEGSFAWARRHPALARHRALLLSCDPLLGATLRSDPGTRTAQAPREDDEAFVLVLPRATGDLPTPRDATTEAAALATLLKDVQEFTSLKLILCPMQPALDQPFCAAVAQAAAGAASVLQPLAAGPHHCSALWQLIAQAQFVVSYRLHGLVCAAALGVPALGVAYDPKVSSFCDEIAYPYCYPATVHEMDTFMLFERYWREREHYMAELALRRQALLSRLEAAERRFQEQW